MSFTDRRGKQFRVGLYRVYNPSQDRTTYYEVYRRGRVWTAREGSGVEHTLGIPHLADSQIMPQRMINAGTLERVELSPDILATLISEARAAKKRAESNLAVLGKFQS